MLSYGGEKAQAQRSSSASLKQVMAAKSYKKEKYGERILHELNMILRRDLNDSRLQFASLTKVQLNRDCSVAKVYWDTFDPHRREDIKKAMEKAVGKMRGRLGQTLDVRTVPILELIYDNQFEEESKITRILEEEKERK